MRPWLAISGSLRSGSSNGAVIRAIQRLAPGGVTIRTFDIAELPHFNPDLETNLPESVRTFYSRVKDSSAFVISTPEYAHGLPGVLKNMLDWLVANEDFYRMPVVLVYARPALFAHASLTEILKTMSAEVSEEWTLVLPHVRTKTNAHGEINDPDVVEILKKFLERIAGVFQERAA